MNEEQGQAASKEEEFSWIRAALSGDRSAFDRLVLRYQDQVFNLCYRMTGEYEEANDCAQEAFVRAYRALKHFRFEARFSTWLVAIAVNICRNRLNSLEYRFRRRMVRIDSSPGDAQEADRFEIRDPAPDALAELTARERERLLQTAIDSLPGDARAVTVLRDVEGFSYEEIARTTGYNPGTVKSKLARAREQLRRKLKGLI